MIWTVFALTTSLLLTEVDAKQVVLCETSLLNHCLQTLSLSVRGQLPDSDAELKQLLGQRGAMVLPLRDENVAGVILLARKQIPDSLSIDLSGSLYSFTLSEQLAVTLWHEIGHLEAINLLELGVFDTLSPYRHEWIADCYLTWRSAKEGKGLDLAWQQYHRRNLNMMQSAENISHWTVPVMAQVLEQYDAEQLAHFNSFSDFIQDALPRLFEEEQDTLAEFASLFHRTFDTQVMQLLPDYMFWRKPVLAQLLEPTLVKLLGEPAAREWMQKQNFSSPLAFKAEP
ncbi:hypothetical protein HWQ46_18090 [Shewanella sp. D64]|uniref:hypothetical protein n=1 Tax=unclassified Shewanella TaxID=196818 RepID=UPI0022BA440C|nr:MULTISPECIES: hypothetical protein [unclassified Shewanella]MEC4727458.1 hypothetical protein [Shewanella sp. D64]MEC4738133.1 hypothetical protein [Shewanella sp. E94]WBJ96354.1 hypothetical protein HWQ47_04310 [Shewanella sp. MTB7]